LLLVNVKSWQLIAGCPFTVTRLAGNGVFPLTVSNPVRATFVNPPAASTPNRSTSALFVRACKLPAVSCWNQMGG